MRILVVEDDPASQKVMTHFLKGIGHCAVAENGAKGLSLFKEAFQSGERFDLVCLDIMMPEMDGQATLNGIRKFEREQGLKSEELTKVVMTTGLNDVSNVMNAFEHGAEAYVTKPISRETLMSEIKKLGIYPVAS